MRKGGWEGIVSVVCVRESVYVCFVSGVQLIKGEDKVQNGLCSEEILSGRTILSDCL